MLRKCTPSVMIIVKKIMKFSSAIFPFTDGTTASTEYADLGDEQQLPKTLDLYYKANDALRH